MRWLRWFARKFWLLVVTLIISLALLVQTGRILSPQVESYRPQISSWLSERLGAPVQMEHISLRWQALEVALQIDKLEFGEAGAVKLGRGLFHLDLLASLWNRELVWKNLEIDSFSAQINQRAEGGWQIQGFPLSKAPAQGGLRLGDPARIFQLGPKVEVLDARIGFQLVDGQSAQLNLRQILLENSQNFHRLTARAFVSGAMENLHSNEETLRVVLEGHGNPRQVEHFSLNGYVQLNQLLVDADLIALLNQLSPLPEKYFWTGRKLAGGKLWLQSAPDEGYRLKGQLSLSQAGSATEMNTSAVADKTASTVEQIVEENVNPAEGLPLDSLQSLSANISGHWLPQKNWQLALQDLSLSWRKLEIPPLNLLVESNNKSGEQASDSGVNGSHVELALDRIELVAWHHILAVLQLLPEKTQQWVEALEPGGSLENIRFERTAEGEISLLANLRDVSTKAYLGAPAVGGVNGFLQLDRNGGRVELDSPDGFSAHFPQLYTDEFEFTQAQGTVAWDIDAAKNSVAIYSGPLRLEGGLGDINGQFLLQLPREPHTKAAEFTLALGLRNGAVTDQRVLVPETLSDDLRSWLNRSLGENNPGRISSAAFLYRGYGYQRGEDAELLKLGDHPQRQTVQLRGDITDAAMDYATGWPKAREVNAQLKVNDQHVWVNASKAKLWSVDARNIQVAVNPRSGGSLLEVHAQLSGPAVDGLKVLQQSPLRKQLGGAFDEWQLNGRIAGELSLSQPLGKAANGLSPTQNIQLQLSDAQLALSNLNLEFSELNGQVGYTSDSGLRGTKLHGNLWGQPLSAKIQHIGRGKERDTQVVVSGQSSAAAVREWSKRPELSWLDGEFDYDARITIPAKVNAKAYTAVLEVNSDLQNVAVNLPAPLGKAANKKSRLVLRVPFGSEGNLYHLSYGEHLQGQFWQVNGQLDRAVVALNAEAKLPTQPGVAIVGDLSQIDLQPWRKALEIYQSSQDGDNGEQPAGLEEQDQSDDKTPLLVTLDLSTDLLRLSATEGKAGSAEQALLKSAADIENIHVRGRGLGTDWQLQFDSETAAGELVGVLNAATPLQLKLKHLQLPAVSKPTGTENPVEPTVTDGVAAVQKNDPWHGFNFAGLPQIDFSTESLRLGNESFGPWSFRVRPSAERLVLSEIRGSLRGMRVEGRGEGENKLGAQMMWLRDADGGESSQFIGRLSGDNLAPVLQAWGQEAVIENKSARFDVALRWDGSPAQFSANALAGELKIDIKNGRFLRASDNAGSALLRLLSLFNFDTWARRLRLDFSDLVQSGLTFDRVHGEVYFEGDGELLIAVPIQVEGPSSELQMAGRVNLQREDLNLTLVATLPVGNNLALVAALAGGLPAAAGVYLISKVFKKQVDKVASVSYRINGAWSDPQVRFDKLFDDAIDGIDAGGSPQAPIVERETQQPLPESNSNADRAELSVDSN